MSDNDTPETDGAPVQDEDAPAPRRQRQPVDWARISEAMASIRSVIVDVVILGLIVATIGILVAELRKEAVVIEPIRLPESLSAMGYSEDVAALRLWDAVVEVNASTPTEKERVDLLPASQRVDFEAAGSGISLQTLLRILRPFLGIEEIRIAGEFICATPDCAPQDLALRLRVFSDRGMKIIPMRPVGEGAGKEELDRYFRDAALELLREIDPYVVAFYLFQSDKDAAEREALKLIGPANPQRKWALNLLGFIAASRGEYDEAVRWYAQAVAADPEDGFAVAYANWGATLQAAGAPDEAIQKLERAVMIDPAYASAHANWASALADKGDLDGAVAKLEHAVSLEPDNAYIYSLWGNVLYRRGDLDGSIEKYRRATELDPAFAFAHFNWGLVLEDKGDAEGAIEQYARTVEIDPGDSAALTKWGAALLTLDRADVAAEKFALAIEADPGNARAHNSLGMILARKGEIDEAAKNFARAVEIAPDMADGQFNLGLILRMMNRAGAAADAFERYLELRPAAENAETVRGLVAQLRAAQASRE